MKPETLWTLVVTIPLLTLAQGCGGHRAVVTTPTLSGPITLQAGTTLALRTAERIDTSSARQGGTFAAVVTRDTSDAKGQMVLPSGSPATLELTDSSNVFQLRLASVMLNGDAFLVHEEAESPGLAGQSGSSLGKFLGGVAGTAGGVSGPLVFTSERIEAPVGSLLTFRLEHSIALVGSPKMEK